MIFLIALLLSSHSFSLHPFPLRPNTGQRVSFYNTTMRQEEIRVQGTGSGDVDCYLYGRDGRFLESDTGSNDSCSLRTPAKMPGRYIVEMFNEGDAVGMYRVTGEVVP